MSKSKDYRTDLNRQKMVGMKVKASNGQIMECIEYFGVSNLTVRFEDNTIINNVYKSCFLKGTVKNPNKPCINHNTKKKSDASNKYIGKQVKAKNGMMMKCIAYHDSNNITIQFENGCIREKVRVTEFLRGLVREDKALKYVGMKIRAYNGQLMECIEYFDSTNITIQFEDGVIVRNKAVGSFIKGQIRNPNLKRISNKKEDHTGEVSYTNTGYLITIAEYIDASNIIVKFEDGLTKRTDLASFRKGKISYPISQDLKRPFAFHNYIAQFIFHDANHAYYICKCPKCNFDQILSVKEMLEPHVCDS